MKIKSSFLLLDVGGRLEQVSQYRYIARDRHFLVDAVLASVTTSTTVCHR